MDEHEIPKRAGRPPKETGYKRHLVSARLSQASWNNAMHCAERAGLTLAQLIDVLLAQAPQHPAFAPYFEAACEVPAIERLVPLAPGADEGLARDLARLERHGLAHLSEFDEVDLAIAALESPTGRVTYANRQARELLGSESPVGGPVGEAFPALGDRLARIIEASVTGEAFSEAALRLAHPDGAERILDLRVEPRWSERGRCVGMLLTARDRTHEWRAREAYERILARRQGLLAKEGPEPF